MSETNKVHGLSRDDRAEIPMPRPRRRLQVILPGLALLAILALITISNKDAILPATEVRAMPVIVKTMSADAPGSVTVQAPGWLEPDPHPYYVSALTDGVIAEVLVLEGEAVEAGQVVARLIDEDARLEQQRAGARLDERSSASVAAEAELQAARENIEHLIDRRAAVDSARAELQAVIAERVRLEAEIAAAEATALGTKDEVGRKEKLLESQAVARGEVERLRLRLRAEQARLLASRANLPVLEARQFGAESRLRAAEQHAELLIDERRAVKLTEAGLGLAKAAERQAATALAEAELRLSRTEIRAEVSGVVLERMVVPGSRVQSTSQEHSAHVLHLYDPAHLQVRVDVPLADAGQVGVGQQAEIVVDALPDHRFSGEVSRLIHVADIAKNTVEVKVRVREPRAVLKPEMLARVRFLSNTAANDEGELRQRLFAPRAALRSDGVGEHVMVAGGLSDGRGRVERRTVTVGMAAIEDFVEISSGLRPGDRVIVDAPHDLENGDSVVLRHDSEFEGEGN